MRKLIVGDIHGEYDKLIEVLSKANFNENDILYSVGDFCDRGNKNLEVLEFLMSLDNFRAVRGNHDVWLYNYLLLGYPDRIWLNYNGGYKTYDQIYNLPIDKKKDILSWLRKFRYTIYEDKFMIVHGGPESEFIMKEISEQDITGIDYTNDSEDNIVWDRYYFVNAYLDKGEPIETDKDIFIGHTPVQRITNEPFPYINNRYHLINIDTGACKGGVLTVMDIETKEYWQA